MATKESTLIATKETKLTRNGKTNGSNGAPNGEAANGYTAESIRG